MSSKRSATGSTMSLPDLSALHARGRWPPPEGPRVAIVGSRRPSPYGEAVAEQLGTDLARAGAIVVSGLALGIDAAAHRGALNGGSAAVHQQLFWRPIPGLGRPETPIRRLYLGSASAHPGGGEPRAVDLDAF